MARQRYIGLTKQVLSNGGFSNIDYLYGPYSSITEGLKAVPSEYRALGRTLGIITDGVVKEYWFESGIKDSDLIPKFSDPSDYEAMLSNYCTKGNLSTVMQDFETTFTGITDALDSRVTAIEKAEGTALKHASIITGNPHHVNFSELYGTLSVNQIPQITTSKISNLDEYISSYLTGGSVTVGIATATKTGVVKGGGNITIAQDGTMSVSTEYFHKHDNKASLDLLTAENVAWIQDISKYLSYDSTNRALKSILDFYSIKGITAYGTGSTTSGTGSGGLITKVYGYGDLGGTYANTTLTDTFNAYTVNKINERLTSLETNGTGITSIGLTVPTGMVVSGSPLTKNGTIGITYGEGYSLPLTAKQTDWDTAFTLSHKHENKTALDLITANDVTWIHALIPYLSYDSVHTAVKVLGDFYATGGVTALSGTGISSGGSVGMIQMVYTYSALGGTFTDSSTLDTFNAYTINKIADRLTTLENKAITSISWGIITDKPTTLSGYGITDVYTKSEIDSKVSSFHTHSNKAYLDVIDQNLSTTSTAQFGILKIGNGYLEWDDTNKSFYVIQSDGTTAAGFYATGGVSAYGTNSTQSTSSGLVNTLYRYINLTDGTAFSDSNNDTFDAYTIKQLYDRIVSLQNGALTSVSWSIIHDKPTTLSGYGITDAYTKTEITSLLSSYALQSQLPTSEQISHWDTAYTNNHTHSNKSALDNITQAQIDWVNSLIDKITYDSTNTSVKINPNLYSEGGITAYGTGSVSSGAGGLITAVYGYSDLSKTFSNETLSDTFNAYTIKQIYSSLTSLQSTALTSHQTIYPLTFVSGTFSSATYNPVSGSSTVNIPTTTSHISEGTNLYFTNDRAVSALSSTLSGYSLTSHTHNYLSTLYVGSTAHSVSSNTITIPAYPTSLPASDVYSWAKQSTKPSYTFSEIGSKPTTLSGYGITDSLSTSNYSSYITSTYIQSTLGTTVYEPYGKAESTISKYYLGGRNLLVLTSATNTTKTSTGFKGAFNKTTIWDSTYVTKWLKPSTTYILSYDFVLNSKPYSTLSDVNFGLALYNGSTYIKTFYLSSSPSLNTTYHYSGSFTTPSSISGYYIVAISGKYQGTDTSGNTVYGYGNATFSSVHLEYGTTESLFAFAPEDTGYSVQTALTEAAQSAASLYLPLTGGTITGNLGVTGYITIGSAKLLYDSTNNCIKLINSDGTSCNFVATGEVTALS